jgi:hypothetical protein
MKVIHLAVVANQSHPQPWRLTEMPSSSIALSELPWPNFAPHTYTSPFAAVPSTALVIICTSDEIQVHSTNQYTQLEA